MDTLSRVHLDVVKDRWVFQGNTGKGSVMCGEKGVFIGGKTEDSGSQ